MTHIDIDPSPGRTVIRLPWDRLPLTLNDRGHTRTWGHKVARVKADAMTAIRAQRVKAVRVDLLPVVITLHWRMPDRRLRDPDNAGLTAKTALDAVVASGILPGDDWRYVAETRQRLTPPQPDREPGMWLHITPAKEKP